MYNSDKISIILCYAFIVLCVETCGTEAHFEHPDIPGIHTDLRENKIKDVPRPTHQKPPEIKPNKDYHDMQAGRVRVIGAEKKDSLNIFCYHGEQKSLSTLFKTVQLNLEIENEEYTHYEGPNVTAIKEEYKSLWGSLYPWKLKSFKVDLYKTSCVGISTKLEYRMGLKIRWVDFWRIMLMTGGVILFFAAAHLAKNIFFHYTTGITIGILGSVLIIVIYFKRFFPTKSAFLTCVVGGGSIFLYMAQYIWQNFVHVVQEYKVVFIGYIIVVGMISFAVVYRYGPLTDHRSLNLVQWALQLVSLVAVFFSSQYREASLGLVIVMLIYYYIPTKWKAKARTLWHRRFPPKIRKLTEEEYIQQGNVETRKALEELRQYCRSPDCNAWKTVSKLKTPTRFAEFIEGNSHLDDDAILAYESNHITPVRDGEDLFLTTDDEDDS